MGNNKVSHNYIPTPTFIRSQCYLAMILITFNTIECLSNSTNQIECNPYQSSALDAERMIWEVLSGIGTMILQYALPAVLSIMILVWPNCLIWGLLLLKNLVLQLLF